PFLHVANPVVLPSISGRNCLQQCCSIRDRRRLVLGRACAQPQTEGQRKQEGIPRLQQLTSPPRCIQFSAPKPARRPNQSPSSQGRCSAAECQQCRVCFEPGQ